MSEEHINSEGTTQQATRPSWKQNMGIPLAIIVAGVIIAGAVYMNGQGPKSAVDVQDGINKAQNTQETPETTVAPITASDHIRGNPNAPIVIVEYSDYDCPFCRIFHDTMNKVMDTYEKSGQVAWVFRHLPLAQLHPNAPKISEAAYCVAELAGNDGFWKFTDALNNSRKVEYDQSGNLRSVEPTNMARMTEFAQAGGAEKSAFELCYNSGKYTEKVAADIEAGLKAGARGTPYSIVMVGGEQGVINGAQPYETVKQIVGNLLTQMNGGTTKEVPKAPEAQ